LLSLMMMMMMIDLVGLTSEYEEIAVHALLIMMMMILISYCEVLDYQ